MLAAAAVSQTRESDAPCKISRRAGATLEVSRELPATKPMFQPTPSRNSAAVKLTGS